MKKAIPYLVAWLLLLGGPPAMAGQAIRVTLKDHVTVSGDRVRLGDLARFDPARGERVLRMKDLDVASSPPPGRTAVFTDRFLMYRLYADLKREEGVKVKIPKRVVVERECARVTERQLERIFRDYVEDHTGLPPGRIHVERVQVGREVLLPAGRVDWVVRGPGRIQPGDLSLIVDFRVNGISQRKAHLSGRISVEQEVVRTARAIKAGTVLSPADLVTVRERRIRPALDAFSSPEALVGMRTRRGLSSGDVVTKQAVEPVPLVVKGRRVLVKAENEHIRITTYGKALQDGAAGEQIRVVNLGSGKEIHATVRAPGLVEVFF